MSFHYSDSETCKETTRTQAPSPSTTLEFSLQQVQREKEGWRQASEKELVDNFQHRCVYEIATDAEVRECEGFPLPMKCVWTMKRSEGNQRIKKC